MAFPIYRRNVILSLFSHYTFNSQHTHASRVQYLRTLSLSLSLSILDLSFASTNSNKDTWSFTWISDFNTNYSIKFRSIVLLRLALPLTRRHLHFAHTTHLRILYDYHKKTAISPYTTLTRSRDSTGSIMTRLRDGRPRNRGSILSRGKKFFSSIKSPGRLCGPLSLLYNIWRGWGVKLTTYLHPVPR